MSKNNGFTSSMEFPGELSKAQNGLSIDVLIYDTKTKDHTVGWYDFNAMTWRFLSNEPHKQFVWRYFKDHIDKPSKCDHDELIETQTGIACRICGEHS